MFDQRPSEIPKDPNNFIGFFQFYQLDEHNGETTPQTKVQMIPLSMSKDILCYPDDEYAFEGTAIPWEHPKTNCPLSNHTNGMHFGIVCSNYGVERSSFLWLRELDATELQKTIKGSDTFELDGGSPQVPMGKCAGVVTIHTESRGHVLYVKRVYFTLSAKAYKEWVKTL